MREIHSSPTPCLESVAGGSLVEKRITCRQLIINNNKGGGTMRFRKSNFNPRTQTWVNSNLSEEEFIKELTTNALGTSVIVRSEELADDNTLIRIAALKKAADEQGLTLAKVEFQNDRIGFMVTNDQKPDTSLNSKYSIDETAINAVKSML